MIYFHFLKGCFRPIEVNRYHPVKRFSVFSVVAVIDSLSFFFSIVVVSLLSIIIVVIEVLLLIFILDVGRL